MTRYSLFLLPWVPLVACSVQEPARPASDPVLLARGRAVEPWDAANARPLADAEPGDAGSLDAGAATTLDATAAMDASILDAAILDASAVLAAKPSRLAFRVTTRSQAGRYQPKNVGAIWVEDATGRGVQTLALWASLRIRYLADYLASNPMRNTLDAVTSATLRDHQTHEVTWNLRGANGQAVPDGMYSVMVEVTDRDAPGQVMSVMFRKGSEPMRINPADGQYFSDIELRYE